MSPVKEPNYFAPDLADPRDNMLRHGTDESLYLDLFAGAGSALRIGEGSVRYLYSRVAPALIRAAQPDPRILVILRNPVDMAYSLYNHMVASGVETAPAFGQALDAEEDRRQGRAVPSRMNPLLSTYTDRARYGEQLPRWLDTFGTDRVLVIIFEEFVARPASAFRGVLDFIGVDPGYQPPEFASHNAAHAVSNSTLRKVLNTAPAQWLVWRAAPRVFGDARTRSLVQRFRHSRLHRRPLVPDAIPAELRARLVESFRPDVTALSALLGRDLASFWFDRRAAAAPLVEVGGAS
jgi:hypothetical protein